MNYLEHNRRAWNNGSMSRSVWARPVDEATIARARAAMWEVLLTPKTPVPKAWFGDLHGKHVLCLASGGGQQAPILAAAGATVVSFDLSEEQLRKDRLVAQREKLHVSCVRGDMADLGCFGDGSFDLIFHPASNVFIADPLPVWRECYRVLRTGGALLSGFMNPAAFMFDEKEAEVTGRLVVKYSLPYSDLGSLSPAEQKAKVEAEEPLEFSHSLTSQIGGQIEAGFLIAGFYEDHSFDETWLFNKFSPVSIATRALRK